MDKNVRHVMPALKGGWVVKAAGASRATSTFKTKDAAVKKGRDLAQRDRGTLYIHKSDGSISEKRTFNEGKDAARSG